MHGDIEDEFDELARALEGVEEDLVRSIKVNNPELQTSLCLDEEFGAAAINWPKSLHSSM